MTDKLMDWYLSFAGDKGFQGAVIVPECHTFLEAIVKVTLAEINPGGECVGVPIYRDRLTVEEQRLSDALPRMHLITLEDLKRQNMDPVTLNGDPA